MPIVIKRYRNRKLYNTETKRYITLDQISDLIQEHKDVKVVDNGTGEDITAATMSQIIFEGEKNRSRSLPTSLLFSLVASGGMHIEELRQNIFESLNLAHHYDVEIERRIDRLIDRGEMTPKDGTLILKKLLSVSSRNDEVVENLESRIAEFLHERQVPTKNDLSLLIQKIENLSLRVQELNNENTAQK
jgi:polyhydroxyalkanoate synthesis repressor PhaR